MPRDLQKVVQAIDGLEYDFAQFEIQHFVSHLEKRRQRGITLQAIKLEAGITGLYVAGPFNDYIFYRRNTPAIHQTHIILHEIGHIVMNHPAQPMDYHASLEDGIAGIVRQLRDITSKPSNPDIEWEAEQFAFLVYQRVYGSQPEPVTSNPRLKLFIDSLMLDQ